MTVNDLPGPTKKQHMSFVGPAEQHLLVAGHRAAWQFGIDPESGGRSMPGEFQVGQHIIIEQLIDDGREMPVPPGRYVIAQVKHDLLGNAQICIRSLPDEDIEAEVDSGTLSQAARREGE